MKRIKFILIIAELLMGSILFAQRMSGPYHGKSEVIKAEKIKFLNNKLNLTTEESEKFWPIYDDFQNRRERIFNERKNNISFVSDNADNMNNDEINKYAILILESYKQESDLMNEYFKKFKEVIPISKAVKIFNAEHEFKKYLMRYVRDNESFGRKGKDHRGN